MTYIDSSTLKGMRDAVKSHACAARTDSEKRGKLSIYTNRSILDSEKRIRIRKNETKCVRFLSETLDETHSFINAAVFGAATCSVVEKLGLKVGPGCMISHVTYTV